jgi:hypothetical protein
MINKAAALRSLSQLMKLVSKRAALTSLSEYNNCNPTEFGAACCERRRRELAYTQPGRNKFHSLRVCKIQRLQQIQALISTQRSSKGLIASVCRMNIFFARTQQGSCHCALVCVCAAAAANKSACTEYTLRFFPLAS